MQTEDTNNSQPEKSKQYYFDTVNIKVPRKGKEMTTFLKEGMGTCGNLRHPRSILYFARSLMSFLKMLIEGAFRYIKNIDCV